VVELVTSLGGVPLDSATTYVLREFLPFVAHLGPHDDWFSLYSLAGIELGATEHSIEASVADPYSAAILAVEVGHPLLVLERLVHDSSGTPVEYAFTRIRGDRLTLQQRMQQ
jgi:GntR family transcriptional regulator